MTTPTVTPVAEAIKRTVDCRAPTPAEAAFYADPHCGRCQTTGRVTFVRPEGRLTVMCPCSAKRMVKEHPGTMLTTDGRIFIDIEAEVTWAREAKRERERVAALAEKPLVTL